MTEIQNVVLRNLLNNDEFLRRTIPYIKREYFTGVHSKLFNTLSGYVTEYNKLPTKEAFVYAIQEDEKSYTQDDLGELNIVVDDIYADVEADMDWLIDKTEKWCQDRAVFNAIMKSMSIINGEGDEGPGCIPDLLQDALGVTFDANVGHDYIENYEDRYEKLHEDLERLPFDLDYFNRITLGGLVRKTLNVILAGTGVGKSLTMCHMAAGYLASGKNVLYISGEMAEEKIAERIDANLFDVPIDQLDTLSKDMFRSNIQKIREKSAGGLIIKEFPTGQAHAGHIRALLNELKLKKNFTPDVIFIDYLNIFASSRVRGMGGAINSYTYVKSIAEEMRGLAVEFDVPVVTATQTNREGYQSSDVELTDTSESFGLPMTADLFISLTTTDELRKANQILVKQLKSRYDDLNKLRRFFIGVDYSKMKLYDIPEHEQTAMKMGDEQEEDEGPVFDKGEIGGRRYNKPLEGINV